MTYKEARELALRAMAQREEGSEQRWATFGETLDAALSAFSAAGWTLCPDEPKDAMLDRGVAMALNVTVTGEGGWSKYIRALYLTMLQAFKHKDGQP